MRSEPLTLEEHIGHTSLSNSDARHGYVNEIQTLGPNFFNTDGIETALEQLYAMKDIDRDDWFMGKPGSDEPSPYQPQVRSRPFVQRSEERIAQTFKPHYDDNIAVHFHNVQWSAENLYPKRGLLKQPWQRFMLDLIPRLAATPITIQAYAGKEGQERRIEYGPKDTIDVKGPWCPYQLFVKMFNGTLHAYSSFVNGGIDITATTYAGDPAYGRYNGCNSNRWEGTLGEFLNSARTLELALAAIVPNKKPAPSGEIKLFYPGYGMIAMRGASKKYFVDWPRFAQGRTVTNPATLILNNTAYGQLASGTARKFGLEEQTA